jgi:hypothetical protein
MVGDLISVHQQLAQIRQLAYHRLCARVVSCAVRCVHGELRVVD